MSLLAGNTKNGSLFSIRCDDFFLTFCSSYCHTKHNSAVMSNVASKEKFTLKIQPAFTCLQHSGRNLTDCSRNPDPMPQHTTPHLFVPKIESHFIYILYWSIYIWSPTNTRLRRQISTILVHNNIPYKIIFSIYIFVAVIDLCTGRVDDKNTAWLSNPVHLRLNTDRLLHISISRKGCHVIHIVAFQSSCCWFLSLLKFQWLSCWLCS